MPAYIVAIDQGTTGSTVAILKTEPNSVNIVGIANAPFKQHFPKPSWVEHNLTQIWASVEDAGRKALAMAKCQDSSFQDQSIVAVGISNQRETLCLFPSDPTTPPKHPAIVWQCKRSLEICQELKQQKQESLIRERTGLLLDPYFSASKLKWAYQHWDGVKKAFSNGSLLAGTVDSYLVFKLTGGKSFVTEPSNASRTLLYNIHTGKWDPELLEMFDISNPERLPEVRASTSNFGTTKNTSFLPDGIPICAILGDQQAALAGQCAFQKGEAKCTYGTGAFLLENQGSRAPQNPPPGLLTTIAWQHGQETTYALEGSVFIAGAAVQYLRDNLGFIKESEDSEKRSQKVEAAPNLYFVPGLSGLGAPHWEPSARGTIFGLTRDSSQDQLIRAALEGVAFSVKDLVDTMSPKSTSPLRVDGGASNNNLLMQIQSNYLRRSVFRPKIHETTALGAGLFAALGVGLYSSMEDLRKLVEVETEFQPNELEDLPDQIAGWNRCISSVRYHYGGTS